MRLRQEAHVRLLLPHTDPHLRNTWSTKKTNMYTSGAAVEGPVIVDTCCGAGLTAYRARQLFEVDVHCDGQVGGAWLRPVQPQLRRHLEAEATLNDVHGTAACVSDFFYRRVLLCMSYRVDHVCHHGDVVVQVRALQRRGRHPLGVLEHGRHGAEAEVVDLQGQR